MTIQNLAMMYAMNVGIEALQGKRGSNLWKDAFKDTALMASLSGFAPKDPNAAKGLNVTEKIVETENIKDPSFFDKWVKQPWEKGANIFKSPQTKLDPYGVAGVYPKGHPKAGEIIMEMKTDPVKVGLGSIGLGGGLYAAGMFDPVDPPEPKYPGYNKFYAENPGQFMPYDDPNIAPIDYSKYPDKPYSGIKKGGIIGLQAGGPPPAEMSDNDFALMLFNKPIDQLQPHQLEALQPYLQNKKEGGIAAFARGGRASNQPHQDVFEATKEEEEERQRQQGIGRAPGPSPRIPYEQDGGIGGYGPGQRAMPEGSYAPTPQVDPRWFHPDNPRFLRPDVQGVKTGALIHRLPSKTKVDENNPKNYKRTSGKLVVDSAGKGSENKDTMLAQLADGEFVTKSKAVRGAGLALGADPKNKKQQKDLGARYFYKQMAEFDKLAKQMAS